MNELKRCVSCSQDKSITDYYVIKGKPIAKCKDCYKLMMSSRRKLIGRVVDRVKVKKVVLPAAEKKKLLKVLKRLNTGLEKAEVAKDIKMVEYIKDIKDLLSIYDSL